MNTDLVQSVDAEQTVDIALEQIARRDRAHRRIRKVLGWLAVVWMLGLVCYRIIKHHYPVTPFLWWVLTYGLTGIGFLVGQLFLERQAFRALAEVDEMRGIAPLMDVAFGTDRNFYNGATRRAAILALIRLLPRVPPGNDLTVQHIQKLRAILSLDGYIIFGKYHPDGMVLAALKCLLAIGDTNILESVERLSSKAHETEVRAAALAALPSLREQIPGRRLMDTLLRPASSEESSLLRVASSTPSDESTLLKPSELPS